MNVEKGERNLETCREVQTILIHARPDLFFQHLVFVAEQLRHVSAGINWTAHKLNKSWARVREGSPLQDLSP